MCMPSLCILDNGGPKGWARLNKTLTRHKSVLVAFKQKTSTQRNAQQISSVSKISVEWAENREIKLDVTPDGKRQI